MPDKKVDHFSQLVVFLTGGPPLKVRSRDDGIPGLVVIAHDGKKHFFTKDEIDTAIEAMKNQPKAPKQAPSQAPKQAPAPRSASVSKSESKPAAHKPAGKTNPLAGDLKKTQPPKENPLGADKA